MMKRFFSILRQTAIISLITFGLTEVTFRIYHKINPSFMFYDPSSYNRWRGKPLSTDYDFQLNSRGFKDVEFSKQKAEGTYRILGIGDSFAYGGIPYKHNFLTLLESKLNQDSRQPIELINMGIIAIGPKDYLSLLVNEGLELNPDMVLLSFYVGNDFSDNYKSQQDRRLLKVQDSYVFSFFYFLIKVNSKFEGNLYHHNIEYREDLPTVPDDFHLEEAKKRSYIFFKNPEETEFKEHFNDALGDLLKIKEICDRRNITLVVVLMPDEVQVIKELRDKVVASYNFTPDKFDFRQPNKLLSQALIRNNIYYLDIVEEFVTAGTQTPLYKPNDIHWNIAGNRLAAEVIDKYLSEEFFQ
ncbi:MAG: SGNH/GDSL hydrolase family protein [Okeania sp. SIO3H1]|nr:SGNH/GDSL hydrolase family protein [Okeania sp. SIO3H1]NET28397.1 SGNH/GDSL hydrolase family protein [Okeania sp. SIO1I7]